MESTRSLAARTQLPAFSGDRDEKPPMVGLVPTQARVNFLQLARQADNIAKGLYEDNLPTLRASPEDLGLFQGQIAFVASNTGSGVKSSIGYPLVQTSLNGYTGSPHEDLAQLYQDLLHSMPNRKEFVERLIVEAIQARIVVVGQVMEDTPAITEQRTMRHSNNPTSIMVRGLVGQYNLTEKPMQVGQSVVFRPMTFAQALRPSNVAKFQTGQQPLRRYAVGLVATTEDHNTLAERQELHMQTFLRDTELYWRLFDAAHSRIGRCELLACEQVAQGQLMQGIAFVGGLMDAGIVCLNGGMTTDDAQSQIVTTPQSAIRSARVGTSMIIRPATNCADMHMYAKQMITPFLATDNRTLAFSGERNNNPEGLDGDNPINAVAAYHTTLFQVQLAELLALIRPSSSTEASQFAGITQQWMSDGDNRQAALALRDVLLRRMNVSVSNDSIQALAHEPGAYRLMSGGAMAVDNPAYASSTSSGVRAPDINTGPGRLLSKMQVAPRMVALGHAQLFASHGVHGVVTQSAPVNGMAHIFLGGGTGRLM